MKELFEAAKTAQRVANAAMENRHRTYQLHSEADTAYVEAHKEEIAALNALADVLGNGAICVSGVYYRIAWHKSYGQDPPKPKSLEAFEVHSLDGPWDGLLMGIMTPAVIDGWSEGKDGPVHPLGDAHV